jgi:hypothetical protein
MIAGSYEDAARLLVDAKFIGWQIVVMGAIGFAESHLDPHAIGDNDENPASIWYLSVDWGVWQINDAANQELLVARGVLTRYKALSQQLRDPMTNALAARAVFESRGGPRDPIAGYNAWTTFKNGDYVEFKPAALKAARSIGVAV